MLETYLGQNCQNFNNTRKSYFQELFEKFSQSLYKFNDWMTEFELTIPDLVNLINPGTLLICESKMTILNGAKAIEQSNPVTSGSLQIMSYLSWVKKQPGFKYIYRCTRSEQEFATFFINGHTTFTNGSAEATLMSDFKLQTLPPIRFDSVAYHNRGGYNLDFLCFSSFQESGQQNSILTDSSLTVSHFEKFRLTDSNLYHVNFSSCSFGEFDVKDCLIQKLGFSACSNGTQANFKFENNQILGLKFDKTHFYNFVFSNRSSLNVTLKPGKGAYKYLPMVSIVYVDLVKNNHQKSALDFFLLEKRLLRKFYLNPEQDLEMRKELHGKWRFWVKGKLLVKFIVNLLSDLTNGYGHSPAKIILTSISTIFAYGITYYLMDPCMFEKKFSNSIYFSTVTFTTLGYGDILPKTTEMRLLCGSEALIGAILVALIVTTYLNKSRIN